MQSVAVPAGTFKSYVIDESIATSATTTVSVTIGGKTITKTTKSSNTESGKEYWAPNVGLVESAIGGSHGTDRFHRQRATLASTGKIHTGTLPKTTLTAGQKTNITAKLTLTNTAKTAIKGPLAISYYLSQYPSVATGEIPLNKSVTPTVNIAAKASDPFTLNITDIIPASTPTGLYYIVAEVTDYTGSIRDFAASSTQ